MMRGNLKKEILTFLAVTFVVAACGPLAYAEDEVPSADFSAAFLSAYIWRGQELSKDSMVIQPSMTVSYKDFSANLWGNLDTDPYTSTGADTRTNWNETDFTLAYARECGMFSAELGWVYYGLDSADDSQEFYLSLGADTLLSPTLTLYRDIDSAPHWYVLLGISHAVELSEAISLEMSGSISYLKSDDVDAYPEYNDQLVATTDKFDNLHDGVISVSLPMSVAKYCTVTPLVSYVFPLSSDAGNDMEARSQKGDDDTFFFGGVTVSLAF